MGKFKLHVLDLEEMREERREGFSVEAKESSGGHRGSLTLENLLFFLCLLL